MSLQLESRWSSSHQWPDETDDTRPRARCTPCGTRAYRAAHGRVSAIRSKASVGNLRLQQLQDTTKVTGKQVAYPCSTASRDRRPKAAVAPP